MAKLTPAQECAVELYKSHNTPIKRLRYLDNAAILNESGFPVYDVEIISRYIREAEQRGREEALNSLWKFVMGERDDEKCWQHTLDKIAQMLTKEKLDAALSTPEAPHD